MSGKLQQQHGERKNVWRGFRLSLAECYVERLSIIYEVNIFAEKHHGNVAAVR
jgi:hypothetical protein